MSYGFTIVDTALSSERAGSLSRCTSRSQPIMVVKYRRKDVWVRLVPDLPGPSCSFVLKKVTYTPLMMHVMPYKCFEPQNRTECFKSNAKQIKNGDKLCLIRRENSCFFVSQPLHVSRIESCYSLILSCVFAHDHILQGFEMHKGKNYVYELL